MSHLSCRFELKTNSAVLLHLTIVQYIYVNKWSIKYNMWIFLLVQAASSFSSWTILARMVHRGDRL